MVGLVLALLGSRSHDCRLILTDLDEDSLRLARHNAQKSRQVFNSVCECRTLDWKEPHNFTIDEDLGLIVASECIYNADSIPDLVTTMSDLVRRCRRDSSKGSPGPRVLISTKRRHSSEEMFFDLMSNAGFKQLEHTAIPMCDGYRESTGQDPETVDIHMFEQPAEV